MTKFQETIMVRGIANGLMAMGMPRLYNLNQMLNQYGWQVVRKRNYYQRNEQKTISD